MTHHYSDILLVISNNSLIQPKLNCPDVVLSLYKQPNISFRCLLLKKQLNSKQQICSQIHYHWLYQWCVHWQCFPIKNSALFTVVFRHWKHFTSGQEKKNSFSDLNLNLKLHLNLIQSVNPSLKSFVVAYNHHFDDCVEVSEVNDLISHGCYFLLDFSLWHDLSSGLVFSQWWWW